MSACVAMHMCLCVREKKASELGDILLSWGKRERLSPRALLPLFIRGLRGRMAKQISMDVLLYF